jgi:hypothetical protein
VGFSLGELRCVWVRFILVVDVSGALADRRERSRMAHLFPPALAVPLAKYGCHSGFCNIRSTLVYCFQPIGLTELGPFYDWDVFFQERGRRDMKAILQHYWTKVVEFQGNPRTSIVVRGGSIHEAV